MVTATLTGRAITKGGATKRLLSAGGILERKCISFGDRRCKATAMGSVNKKGVKLHTTSDNPDNTWISLTTHYIGLQ